MLTESFKKGVSFNRSQMWVMPFLLLNSAIGLVLLVAAPMISVGFKQFCDNIEEVSGINK
jgi:hypothetical protein